MDFRKEVITIPNFITLMRIFLAFFVGYFISAGFYEYALYSFLAAIFSDFLDGLLARWLNSATYIGRLFDPIADKVLAFFTFIPLMIYKNLPIIFIVILIIRELIMFVGSFLVIGKGKKEIKPNVFGKLMIVSFGMVAISYILDLPGKKVAIFFSIILMIISLGIYIKDYFSAI